MTSGPTAGRFVYRAVSPSIDHPERVREPICRRCYGEVVFAANFGMVVCDRDSDELACAPACRGCGQELVPDYRVPPVWRRSSWRRGCSCELPKPTPDSASPEDLRRVAALLKERGLSASDQWAQPTLNDLSVSRTKVIFAISPSEEITVTADDIEAVLGHDL